MKDLLFKQFEMVFGTPGPSFYWSLGLGVLAFIAVVVYLVHKTKGPDFLHEVEQLKTLSEKSKTDSAYHMLGCLPEASDEELKKNYHLKMAQNHPDKLDGAGLDEEFSALAESRSQKINEAWIKIKKLRGIK